MDYLSLEHPARYYIFYLLSRRQYRCVDIIAKLIQQNMPVPTDEREFDTFSRSLKLAQQQMVFPPGYDPRDLSHAPTAVWLHEHRIHDLWAGEPEVTYAIDILDQPSLRRELEILLMGPLRFIDIAARLVELHGLDPRVMNVATVRYYAHYFWNTETMTSQRWERMLNSLPDDYFSVFSAPRSQVGAAMSVYIATRGGSGIPKETVMFRYIRDCCFMEFIKVTSARQPGMGKSAAMAGLVTSLISAQEQVDMRRGGSAELMDELRRMETRYDERRLTSAAELPLHSLPAELEREKENAS